MKHEPKVIHCAVRTGGPSDGLIEHHIECRFEDGQQFAAIIVDGNFENLAFAICDFLNSKEYKDRRTIHP